MAGIGTHPGPLGRGRVAVSPLDEVQQLVDIGRHVGHGDAALLSAEALGVVGRVLAGDAGSQHGQRLGTDVLAELEILVEAEATRLVVVPDVEVGLACLQRAHRLVPVIDVLETLSVAHAAAREAHELGMERGDGLGQVLAQTVLTAHERLAGEQRDHIDAHVGCLQRYDGQAGFVAAALGGERSSILLPVRSAGLQLALCQHGAVLSYQLDEEVLLLTTGKDIHGEVVFLARFNDHSVPALVPERVVPKQGVVGVVGMQRMVGADLDGSGGVPGGGGVPAAVVLRGVLEVAVLHHLSIETTVGSIADVLEEDADELIADGFFTAHVDFEPCGEGLPEPGEVLRIVVHALVGCPPVSARLCEMLLNLRHFITVQYKQVALLQTAVDGGSVALPGLVAHRGGLIGLEAAEVGRGHDVTPALLRLVVDVEHALSVLTDHGFEALPDRLARIVLRTPVHEVAAVGGSKDGRVVVDLEHEPPCAVLGAAHRGMVHALLGAPGAVVARTEAPHLVPSVGLVAGDVQSGVLAG